MTPTMVAHVSVSPKRYTGRRRCAAHRCDSLNLFATRSPDKTNQNDQSLAIHPEKQMSIMNTITTTVADKNVESSVCDLKVNKHSGKLIHVPVQSVTQTSEERSLAYLQGLCNDDKDDNSKKNPVTD
uniref:Glutamyl-tRNA reductase n=1 Tax=Lygus hesperus TaxID=30085 RepID=A0A0A9X3Q8_LYGHE